MPASYGTSSRRTDHGGALQQLAGGRLAAGWWQAGGCWLVANCSS